MGVRSPFLRAVVSVVVAFGLTAAACSSDDDDDASPDRTTSTTARSSSTTSTTTSADEQAVLDAYNAFWQSYVEATTSNPMDPNHPGLAQHATGEELDTVRRTILARSSAGEIFRGSMDLAPEVTDLSGDRATIRDCHDDNLEIVDAATGAVKEPDDPVRKLVDVSLVLEGGTWRVATIELEAEGCAA